MGHPKDDAVARASPERGAAAANTDVLRRVAGMVAVILAAALQLAVGYFTLVSGLVAPAWAVALLGLVWVAAVVILVRTARTRPLAAPLVPVLNIAVWWAAMLAGGQWLGWTA